MNFDNYKKGYRERYAFGLEYKRYDKFLYYNLRNVLPKNKNVKILDIGCGFCRVLHMLKTQGYKNLKGIELDNDFVKICKKNGFDVEKADAFKFLEKNQKYDLIIMREVLEHIPKEKTIELLKKINLSLNKNGRFIAIVPNVKNPLTGNYNRWADFTHMVGYTEESLKYILRMSNFSDIKIKPMLYYTKSIKGFLAQLIANILFFLLRVGMLISGQGFKHILNYKLIGIGKK